VPGPRVQLQLTVTPHLSQTALSEAGDAAVGVAPVVDGVELDDAVEAAVEADEAVEIELTEAVVIEVDAAVAVEAAERASIEMKVEVNDMQTVDSTCV